MNTPLKRALREGDELARDSGSMRMSVTGVIVETVAVRGASFAFRNAISPMLDPAWITLSGRPLLVTWTLPSTRM